MLEYGSRRITASGPAMPGTTVAISLQSPRPSDAGKIYALGLSLSTRPAVGTFAGGEVLNLAGDTLLAVTAANTLPGIFSGFQDALDVQARAQARVHIPASVPSRLNLPVHAARRGPRSGRTWRRDHGAVVQHRGAEVGLGIRFTFPREFWSAA